MVSTYAYTSFELSHALLLVAKLLLESESWGEVPYYPEISSAVGSCIDIELRRELDWTRFNKSTGGCVGRNATATNPYYCSIVIAPVCLSLSTKVGKTC